MQRKLSSNQSLLQLDFRKKHHSSHSGGVRKSMPKTNLPASCLLGNCLIVSFQTSSPLIALLVWQFSLRLDELARSRKSGGPFGEATQRASASCLKTPTLTLRKVDRARCDKAIGVLLGPFTKFCMPSFPVQKTPTFELSAPVLLMKEAPSSTSALYL
jgi:hypothetical protein